jgi:hypothetical protein
MHMLCTCCSLRFCDLGFVTRNLIRCQQRPYGPRLLRLLLRRARACFLCECIWAAYGTRQSRLHSIFSSPGQKNQYLLRRDAAWGALPLAPRCDSAPIKPAESKKEGKINPQSPIKSDDFILRAPCWQTSISCVVIKLHMWGMFVLTGVKNAMLDLFRVFFKLILL